MTQPLINLRRGDCPICGRKMPKIGDGEHHCPEAVLNAIDSANSRATNGTDWWQFEEIKFFGDKMKEAERMASYD